MENASKALIIAGAILISILIIGLGVYFYNMAASAGKRASLDSQAAEAHNQQFTSYFGERQSATDVKNLMQTIRSNNITGNTAGETSKITVVFAKESKSLGIQTPAQVSSQVTAGKTYWVGVVNDNAVSDDSAEVKNVGEAAYYSSGYLRIITVQEGTKSPTVK